MENQVSYIGHIMKRFLLWTTKDYLCFCCDQYQWIVSGHHAKKRKKKKQGSIKYLETVNLDMQTLKNDMWMLHKVC